MRARSTRVAVVGLKTLFAAATPAVFVSLILAPSSSSAVTPNCGQCRTATWDPEGFWWCDPAPKNGRACDDGSLCTSGDHCTGGQCVGTATTCTALDACHVAGTCNPSTGVCSNPAGNDGAQCSDGNLCTTGDHCSAGQCVATPVTCTALDQCHVAGSCDLSTGICSNPVKTGNPPPACNDGNACTYDDHCNAAGQCVATPISCTSTTCQTLACQGTSTCLVVSNASPAIVCNDGNACTSNDHCDGMGACTGTPMIGCTATPDHGCANPNKSLGTPCDDVVACTYNDQCDGNGSCVGTAITCSPRAPYCESVACNGTSSCSYTPLPADTACPGVDDPCAACDGASNICRMP